MGNPEIKDIVSHVDEDGGNTLDPKEWKKITELFSMGSKPLSNVPDMPKNGDKFITKEEQDRISAQKKDIKETTRANKKIEKENRNLALLQQHLDDPKVLEELVNMVGNRIDRISNKEDIQYYKDFLIALQAHIQPKLPQDGLTNSELLKDKNDISYEFTNVNNNAKEKIELLKEKESKFAPVQATATTESKKDPEKPITSNPQATSFEKTLTTLIEKDKGNPKIMEVISNLEIGKLTPENIPHFADMMLVLRQMNTLGKDQVMEITDRVIATKFTDNKDNPEMKGFKEILSAVLDKGLIGEFINKVEEDLNKNDKLKGSSYDVLLNPGTNLTSPEARAGINNLFHSDEMMFNKLVIDFNDSTKKQQVGNIIKQYIVSSVPNGDNPLKADIVSSTITLNQNFDVNGGQKSAFIFTKAGGNPLGIEERDDQGKVKLDENQQPKLVQKFTPFFGDARFGKAIPLDQTLNTKLMEGVVGKEGLDMKNSAAVMKQVVEVGGKTMRLSDAISAFFSGPLWDEIRKIFMVLSGALSKDGLDRSSQIELAMIDSKSRIKSYLNTPESAVLKSSFNISNDSQVLERLKDYKWNEIQDSTSGRTTNYANGEKEYFTYLSPENQIRYLYGQKTGLTDGTKNIPARDTSWTPEKMPNSQNATPATTEVPSEQQDSIVLIEGNPTLVGSLKGVVTGGPGSVELKGVDGSQYLTVDGQVVPLNVGANGVKTGDVFVKMEENKVQKKTITLNADSKSLTIADGGSPLDIGNQSQQKDVLSNGKFSYYKINENTTGSKDMFHYLAFSLEGNPQLKAMYDVIKDDTTKLPEFEKALVKIQSEVMKLSDLERTAADISGIIGATLDHAAPAGDPKKTQFNTALTDRKKMFSAPEKKG